jgi:hypothetical protein
MPEYLEFKNVGAALAGPIPDLIVATWQEVAAGHRATGQYVADTSFTRMFPYNGNPLSVAVANHSPHAQVLEEGHAGFHLPSRINWPTPKSKVSKKGTFYLRVPFRHMTPGAESEGISSLRARTAMPHEVHRAALQAFKGGRTPSFPIARDPKTGRMMYRGQLSRPYRAMGVAPWFNRAGVQTGPPDSYTWRTGKYEGMRRILQKSPGGRTTGSTFMTWRTLSQTSAGWWIPPMPGFHFAQQVVAKIGPQVSEIIAAAVGRDVADIISLKYAGTT